MKKEFIKQSNWIKNLIVLIGVLVGTLILSNAKAQKLERSPLWEMKGKEIKVSYIYSTFHLLPQGNFHLKERVIEAFDASEQIILELDINDPNTQAEMMRNMAMKGGSTVLTKEDLKLPDEQLKSAVGLGLAQVNTLKPFILW